MEIVLNYDIKRRYRENGFSDFVVIYVSWS